MIVTKQLLKEENGVKKVDAFDKELGLLEAEKVSKQINPREDAKSMAILSAFGDFSQESQTE